MDSAVETPTNPPIARLTPLADVMAMIAREARPVAARGAPLAAAARGIVAEDVVPPALPAKAIALIDGWALASEATRDAGGYAPAPLPGLPQRVAPGQPMPEGTDCVAAFDAVKVTGSRAEALAAVNAGDGVLPARADADPAVPLRRAGERLRPIDAAVCAAAGIVQMRVRMPRIHCLSVGDAPPLRAAQHLLHADMQARGAVPVAFAGDLPALLHEGDADAAVIIGGSGSGATDASVATLAREGRLLVHGVALSPGETAAFGMVGARPVLVLPGRLDAALAAWLTLGRRLLHGLDGGDTFEDAAETLALSRKVTSTVGLSELVPVRRGGETVEPLASKYLPWSALTRSDGWMLVPADSEGYSAGAKVSVRPWP